MYAGTNAAEIQHESRTMGKYDKYLKYAIAAECILLMVTGVFLCAGKKGILPAAAEPAAQEESGLGEAGKKTQDYIKWVEFHAPEEILTAAYKLDTETYKEDVHLSWIDLLAYLAAKHGGQFPDSAAGELARAAEQLRCGETTIEELTKDMEYFPYYREAYSAILGGFVGEYKIQKKQEDGSLIWESCYGLKAFSPIAKGFYYEDYDDFGASRSYGYARPHLGHDMMGQIGTPI